MEYGIDPHSGTHDMYITYNKVYNNNHGVICSVACYNMHITNNELYNNQRDGIFMDAGSHHSTIANNIIHDEDVAIQLPSLSYSEVYGNTITNSKYGIEFETQIGSVFDDDGRCVPYGCVSINNNVHDNNIKATSIGLWAKNGASSNTFAANTINGANGDRGIVVDGSKTSNNIFKDNHISNAKYSVRVTGGNTNTKFINNYLDTVAPSGEYTLASSSALKVESTKFSSDVIRGLDSSSIPVSISKSGTISVKDGSSTKSYNTDTQSYSKTLTNNGKITVTSSSSSATSIASPLVTDTATAAVVNDNSSNYTLNEGSSNNKANSLQQQSAERQANLAKQQAQQQLDNNLKIDSKQLTQAANRSTEAQSQNDGQGAKPDKIEILDPNVSGKHVIRNERTDNMKSESNHKNTDRSSKLSPSINDEQTLDHETLLSFKIIEGSGNGNYLLTGNLRDKNTGSPLQGMKVFFTTDSPIKISNQTTNKAGSFIYQYTNQTRKHFKVQAHFDKLNHHDATDSRTIILKIKSDKPDTPLEDHGSRNAAISRHATPDGVNTKTNDTSVAIR